MMDQPGENPAVQGENTAPPQAPALGVTLREAREHLGLSVADVANQTKLAPRQIEALEAEDFGHLPEMPFVRGFVRSYAKILQLDAQPLLAALPQNETPLNPLSNSVEAPFPNAHSAQQQNLLWLGMALLLSVLVVAFAVWHFTMPPAQTSAAPSETADGGTDHAFPAPLADAGMEQPSVKEEPPAAPADKAAATQPEPGISATKAQTVIQPEDRPAVSPQNAVLRLAFDGESWVEVKDKESKVLSSQINPQGSELLLDGAAPFALVVGHAVSVRLYYRGKQIDLTPHIKRSTDVAYLTLE